MVYEIFENKFPHISVIDEASDFKFGMPLGLTKAHHKITLREKSGPRVGKLPNILESPFNISATAEASKFKFGMQLEFAKGHLNVKNRVYIQVL